MQELIAFIIIFIAIVYLLYQDSIETFDSNLLNNEWTDASIDSPMMSYISIAKGSQHPGVWGISRGEIFFSPLTGSDVPVWTKISSPCGKYITSIVANDTAVVATADDMTTWYCPQPCQNWVQMNKDNSQVDVNTNQLWGIGSDRTISVTPLPCAINGTQVNCQWMPVNSEINDAKNVAVNDQDAWLVSSGNHAWHASLNQCNKSNDELNCFWKLRPNSLTQISVDPVVSNDTIWGVRENGDVLMSRADGAFGQPWINILNPFGAQMQSISVNGPYVWASDTGGNVHATMNTPFMS